MYRLAFSQIFRLADHPTSGYVDFTEISIKDVECIIKTDNLKKAFSLIFVKLTYIRHYTIYIMIYIIYNDKCHYIIFIIHI